MCDGIIACVRSTRQRRASRWLVMACCALSLVACGDSPADPVEVTFDASSTTWQMSLDREQTRNVRDAVSIAAALSALCGLRAPQQVCREISVGLSITSVYVRRAYENGDCLGVVITLRPVPTITPEEVPSGTANCKDNPAEPERRSPSVALRNTGYR